MGIAFPVSMWMKKVAEEPDTRCIVVLEPVERTTGLLYLDSTVSDNSSVAMSLLSVSGCSDDA